MWPFDLIPLLQSLSELKALLREQNSLMRETLRAQGHIPRTQATPALPRLSRTETSAIPRYTDKDVTRVTPEQRAELDLRQQEQQQIPWRDRQQINQLHPAAEPQFDAAVPVATSTAFPTPTPNH